mgnify:CR=1 FL=1
MVMTGIVLQRVPDTVEEIQNYMHYIHHAPPQNIRIYTDVAGYRQTEASQDQSDASSGRRLDETRSVEGNFKSSFNNPCNFFGTGFCGTATTSPTATEYLVVKSSTGTVYFATCNQVKDTHAHLQLVGTSFSVTHKLPMSKKNAEIKVSKTTANNNPMGARAYHVANQQSNIMHLEIDPIDKSTYSSLWTAVKNAIPNTILFYTKIVNEINNVNFEPVDFTFKKGSTNTAGTVTFGVKPYVLHYVLGFPAKAYVFSNTANNVANHELSFNLYYSIETTKPSVCN